MPVFPSSGRYVAFAVETTPGTLKTTGLVYLRSARGSSNAAWIENTQDEYVDTGDLAGRVDTIPNNPHSEVNISVPFWPSQLQTFLAAIGIATGASTAYGPPLPYPSLSWFFGNGLDEDQYAGCQVVGTPTCTMGDPWMWQVPFQGSEKPTQGSPRTPVIPAQERALRRSNLRLATLIGSGTPMTEKKFNSLALSFMNTNTPLFDTRGDGIDGISDFACDYQGINVSLRRAYQTATEKTAYLAECGQDGVIYIPIQTTCGSGTHLHEFKIPRARYTAESLDAQRNDLTREPLTAIGQRLLTTDTDIGFNEFGYRYTVS